MNQRTFFVESLSASIFFLLTLFYSFTLSAADLLVLLAVSFFIVITAAIFHKVQYFKSIFVVSFIAILLTLISLFTVSNSIFSAFIVGTVIFLFLDFMFSVLYIVFKDN